MRRISILLIAIATCMQAKTQLLVNLQLPVVGLSTKSQLWNMVLVNTGGQPLTLKINLIFTDLANNQVVMTGSTGHFNVTAGSHAFQVNDFMPVTYNVVNNSYNIDNNPNGFLPIGNFNVCYQFDRFVNDFYERITEECEEAEVEPLSPPLLMFPEDQALLEIPRPVFNWLPPSPANFFNNLSYDIRLVEVTGLQSPADAMQQNIALFAQQNLLFSTIPYPASYAALDTGKLYAWQVTAKNNGLFVAKTDVWTFRLNQFAESGSTSAAGGAFARLKRDGSINYFLCTGMLQVGYDNYLSDDTVSIAIYDMSNEQSQIQLDSNYVVLHGGQNLLRLSLIGNNGFSNGRIYQFELINSRKERWIGKFYYRREEGQAVNSQ